jgi:Asp-tRNA(Asn)/Glu-tRNA(Gln) amidotransferase A subunit family amidase
VTPLKGAGAIPLGETNWPQWGGRIEPDDPTVTTSSARDHDAMNVPGEIEPTSFTTAASLTGWPAATVRCRPSPEGPPVGVPLVARPWREEVALAAALHLERALVGPRAPAALVAPGAASPSVPPGRP